MTAISRIEMHKRAAGGRRPGANETPNLAAHPKVYKVGTFMGFQPPGSDDAGNAGIAKIRAWNVPRGKFGSVLACECCSWPSRSRRWCSWRPFPTTSGQFRVSGRERGVTRNTGCRFAARCWWPAWAAARRLEPVTSRFRLSRRRGEIDIRRTDGMQRGLYDLDGDVLTLSLADVNRPRPKSLTSGKNRQQRRYVFKRGAKQ